MAMFTGYEEIIEQLVQELGRLTGDEAYIALPGVGELFLKGYVPYQQVGSLSKVSRQYRAFFVIDPNLRDAINGVEPNESIRSDRNDDTAHGPEGHSFPWLTEFAAALRREIIDCGEAEIPGLCRFAVETKPGRAGANPDTGEPIRVPERRILVFKPDRELNHRLARAHTGRFP